MQRFALLESEPMKLGERSAHITRRWAALAAAERVDHDAVGGLGADAPQLDATLAGPGPYTVLAPGDAAFEKLPAETADNLTKPDSRAQLTGLLTYHILPGTVLATDIGKAIDNGKGKAVLATMGGGTLTATKEGDKIVLTDVKGGKATVTKTDDQFSNGVVHHIDTVLTPTEEAPTAG